MTGTLMVRWLVGSHAYGLATPDSDKDYIEVYAEPPSHVTGLSKTKSRQVTGEVDITTYGLRTWADLVAKGNPNMVETLFMEPEYAHPIWLKHIAPYKDSFLFSGAGHRFHGYGTSQLNALIGVKNKKTTRTALVEQYGWDTKWGYHALRILIEGIQLMQTGKLSFPLPDREYLMAVRNGLMSEQDAIDNGHIMLGVLDSVTKTSKLPEHPDFDSINASLHAAYWASWDKPNRKDGS